MKQICKLLLEILKCLHFRYYLYNRDKHFIKELNLPKLTKDEMMSIKYTWPSLSFKKKDIIWSRIYKKEYGFSPYFISDYQFSFILKRFNPIDQNRALQNKAMSDIWFSDLPFPKVYVRGINGDFYDAKMNLLDINGVVLILQSLAECIIKPAVHSGCGKGVKKIYASKLNSKELCDLVTSFNGDFVIQEVLSQHELIADLNPTSLNSCRITTIFINGKFDYSSIIKVGKKNSSIDNWNSSYLIGMDKDGTIHNVGYDINLNKVKQTDSGASFSELKMPGFEKMINLVKIYHKKYFPMCGIIGWDMVVDEEECPHIIEVNLDYPGILGEQLCSGTFFEGFCDEINKQINKQIHKYTNK